MSRKPTTRSDRLAMERYLRDLMKKQQQRIAELEKELKLCQKLHNELFLAYEKLKDKNEGLEEQLKNAIVPKFKVGQEVWCIRFMEIIKFKINKIEIYRGEAEEENRIVYGNWEDMVYQIEENCFATKEEAQTKLEELGENK